ncbi:ribonuclease J [Paenibacillus sp. N4]|uniref:ribonuclease J n=1 Tax=Paenibacillus vietnamensis TaxID=2590547 RepID=UPI001CD07BD4|nr:ribonuclease J [Paenibacillus vietnamensis]MCA0755463.1 ribonuclease J [Paenibacillus vietnamensis]
MQEESLSIFALGGVHEIGKNMYVVQYGESIVVIDCGSKFPDESLLGIDLVIPDITYLLENREKVRALIVTHGHEDHIGGIPYILKRLNIPVYGSGLTLGLIKIKLAENGLLKQTMLHQITPDSRIDLGTISATFFRTNHSIPDCLGVVLHTPEGTVVHTGDFKFDLTPVNQAFPDIHRMAGIGESGVLALLSESTNAERPGFTPSERQVGEQLEGAFQQARQKIFVSTFASNVHRVQQVIDAAFRTDRKLLLLGRSMVNVVSVAIELGHLSMPPDMLIDAHTANELAPEKVAVLCTGSQGEPMAALARLASASYRDFSISRGDTVIFAASPIPGNERNVARTIDHLYLLGAKVIYGSGQQTGMHVSGHASQEELKLMLALMKPKFFIPIHGEYRMLVKHRQLAESVGVLPDHIHIVNNGEVVDIRNQTASRGRRVTAGNTLVDGWGIGDVSSIVLRDRKHLAEDGIIILVMTLHLAENADIGLDVITRGFVYVRESEELIGQVRQVVRQTVKSIEETGDLANWPALKRRVKETTGKFIYAQTKKRPMILPIVIEV